MLTWGGQIKHFWALFYNITLQLGTILGCRSPLSLNESVSLFHTPLHLLRTAAAGGGGEG